MKDKELTIEAAAAFLGVPIKWLEGRIQRDPTFPKRRCGVSWRIPREALAVWYDLHDPTKAEREHYR